VVGWAWVAGTLVQMHVAGTAAMTKQAEQRARPELFGMWTVQKMLLDGVEVPATDVTRWKTFAIDDFGMTWARETSGRVHMFTHQDFTADGVTLKLRTQGEAPGEAWTIERGTQTVQEPHPEPRSMADYGKVVDAERRALVLRGRWGERQVELHLVEKVFRLRRGFHWVQEVPFNR
jgi:hypothetical protein